MQIPLKTTSLVLATFCALPLSLALAGEKTTRIELSRTDFKGSKNTEIIIAKIALDPGARVPLHYHHGQTYTYILNGGTVRLRNGKIRTDKTGTLFNYPRNQIHGGFTITGQKTIEILSVNIVDKEKPLVVLVKP